MERKIIVWLILPGLGQITPKLLCTLDFLLMEVLNLVVQLHPHRSSWGSRVVKCHTRTPTHSPALAMQQLSEEFDMHCRRHVAVQLFNLFVFGIIYKLLRDCNMEH